MNVEKSPLLGREDLPLRLEDAGRVELDPQWCLSGCCSPFMRLYYPLTGGAFLRWNGKTAEMLPGNGYLVPAGLSFDGFCPKTAEKYYFHVSLTRQDGYDETDGIPDILTFPVTDGHLCSIVFAFRERDTGGLLRLKALLARDLGDVLSGISARTMPTVSPRIASAIGYIRSHLSAGLSVTEVAGALYISADTLSRAFRRETGRTLLSYRDEMLLLKAERLLLGTARPVLEIGEALGYRDPFYFSRRFRELSGFSPTEYRNRGGQPMMIKQ